MNILVELFTAQPQKGVKYHGGGEYSKTIFKALVEQYGDIRQIAVCYNHDNYMDKWILDIICSRNIPSYDVKDYYDIEKVIANISFDIFFSGLCFHLREVRTSSNCKKIGTIHDMRRFDLQTDKYMFLYSKSIYDDINSLLRYIVPKKIINLWVTNNYGKLIRNFDELATDSYHSKYGFQTKLSRITGYKPIEVFYTPEKYCDDYVDNKDILTCKIENLGSYILLLGGDRWVKNVYRAILAIEQLCTDNLLSTTKVVIVGNLTKRIKKKIKDINKYHLYDYVEPYLLEKLYKYCSYFIYPTLCEGFGLPPLEAMKYGKTCIVSAISSLPEVCGAAVYYFNPYSINELKYRILQAEDIKIDPGIIIKQYNTIQKKRDEDLNRMCDFIANAK